MARDVHRQETMTGCSVARDSNARSFKPGDTLDIVKYSFDSVEPLKFRPPTFIRGNFELM